MNKCSYCGRENPEEATRCSECGTQEFKAEVPPIIPAQESDKNRPCFKVPLLLRILIAIGVWLLVSGISLYVAWQQANHSIAWIEQWQTRRELKDLELAITTYQQKSNSFPHNFEQLLAMTNDVPSVEIQSERGFVDGWQHPLVFSNAGMTCLIISYGRDGKPGGKGIDCDLTSKNPYPKESVPTFGQFYDNKEMGGMIFSSFFSGALAAFLSFLTVRIPNLNRRGVMILVSSLGATLIGTVFVASMITAVHVPSGH